MDWIISILKHWPRMIGLMVFFGILGIITSLLIPQQYNASVFLSTTIDYNRTGTLDELQEDRILGIPEDLINSDSVLSAACAEETDCTPTNFREHIHISRTLERWRLTYRDSDPKAAVQRALSWQRSAYEELRRAKTAATRSEAYQNELEGLTRCFSDSAYNTPNACGMAPSELNAEIELLSSQISAAQESSHGLSSAILIGSLDREQIELTHGTLPAVGGAIAGILIGMLAAFTLPLLISHTGKESQKDA